MNLVVIRYGPSLIPSRLKFSFSMVGIIISMEVYPENRWHKRSHFIFCATEAMSEAAVIFTKVSMSALLIDTARRAEPLPVLFIIHVAVCTLGEVDGDVKAEALPVESVRL
ncbi:hypothetical protein J2S74_004075 [Evansella vedderi]|uniref:Uncharacterized protein n=1 Tax=Evansella vedderi TaxID=38282 RepID=A0ABT9ZZI1_9BACI|nr:hypothetical protein [Evansella vedderi]MDQ0256653.1 hypothetical protein [Evansella vedderi]